MKGDSLMRGLSEEDIRIRRSHTNHCWRSTWPMLPTEVGTSASRFPCWHRFAVVHGAPELLSLAFRAVLFVQTERHQLNSH